MNQNLQTVNHYHETTKHAQHRYARSLGYMDWNTQPNPFRYYKGSELISLPLAMDNDTVAYHLLDEDLPVAPFVRQAISQLLQFSMGLAAWKESGGSSWAVRCNASSGNLHPTEAYLILPPLLEEQEDQSTVLHYTPKEHALEKLASFDTKFWQGLPKDSFLIGVSSITWREVWKYGERAFRYCNLDAGHAWQAFVVSAKMLGWKITRLDSVSDEDIERLLGLGQSDRFFEREHADMLLVVSPVEIDASLSIDTLVGDLPLRYEGIANQLSSSMQVWDIIPSIEEATSEAQKPQKNVARSRVQKDATKESKEVILKRRSIHVMQEESSRLTQRQFHALLDGIKDSQDGKENSAHLVMFIHQVEDYESGLYMFIRNSRDKDALMTQTHIGFEWKQTAFENLYLLESGDFRAISKGISCTQDIASDGAFSLGMLCNFSEQLQEHGSHRYKELYWECGAIGQQLYLDATSLGLSGTGIGCFLDDMMHDVLGLKDNRFQILYHFTVGRGYVDSRILTKAAYE
jgi:SagB-type dehydrogenase family enzyme